MNLQFKTRGIGPGFYLVATCLQPFLESRIPKFCGRDTLPITLNGGIFYSEFYQTAAIYEQDDSLSKISAVLAKQGNHSYLLF
jgi:hypothetical protein